MEETRPLSLGRAIIIGRHDVPPIIEERDHKLTSEPTFNQPLVWTSRHSRGITGVPRAGPQAPMRAQKHLTEESGHRMLPA